MYNNYGSATKINSILILENDNYNTIGKLLDFKDKNPLKLSDASLESIFAESVTALLAK